MASYPPPLPSDDLSTWEWDTLLDFSLPLPLPSPPPSPTLGIRKRDSRLLCENFAAGRVPCSCPELDEAEALEEAEMAGEEVGIGVGTVAVGVGRKRARGGGVGVVRCQVVGCEVDIGELKGYHKRHRVCLRCANAASVVIGGVSKRYCQQCGKFHVLTDFDEGKRSCRRKLERHNRRRRRKPTDSKDEAAKENELLDSIWIEDVSYGEEELKDSLNEVSLGSDSLCLSNKSVDAEILMESGGHDSPIHSDPSARAVQRNNITSFPFSSEAQIEERTDNPISAISSSLSGNKGAYSTVCPTGRISFKLYDWNPAEFPRRLRHQIFQWLSNMPVELEGYIRPGCTILTMFVAMPHSMWNKLSQDASGCLHNFVKTPDNLFFRRGNVHIYLNNTIFQVLKDGTSLVNVKMEVQVPKLHYVHPLVFEAGKPMEFIACGSNLFQPKFRFLVSFAGKYLSSEYGDPLKYKLVKSGVHGNILGDGDHQIIRIKLPQTKSELFGPAFIEVENESGLSNFIPVLLADKNVCSDLKRMQQPNTFSSDVLSENDSADSFQCLCEASVSRQSLLSELLLDIAWLLKEPHFDRYEAHLSIGNIQRLNALLKYLIERGSFGILQQVLRNVEIIANNKILSDSVRKTYCDEIKILQKNIEKAKDILCHKGQSDGGVELDPGNSICKASYQEKDVVDDAFHTLPNVEQEVEEIRTSQWPKCIPDCNFKDREQEHALLTEPLRQKGVNLLHMQVKRSSGTCGPFYFGSTNSRLAIFMMVSIVTCFGFCIVVFHPHRASEFAVSVRRCVFGGPKQ